MYVLPTAVLAMQVFRKTNSRQWLQSQDLVPLLLAYLSGDSPSATQTSAGDFIKAIITISANASQNEQSCIGPNNLTRQLVSETRIEELISDMLHGGHPLTVGVGIIIEVIRKNNSDYDPDVGAGADQPPSSTDPIYLGTLLRLFAKHVPDFTELILSSNHAINEGEGTVSVKRKDLRIASGNSIEPLGFDRFKTCELMAELLHCSNMGLLNERGSEDYVRQRDEERERLKAEGSLLPAREPRSAITEFSEANTDLQNGGSPLGPGSGPAEETRKLEVANSVDEDGYEDVGAAVDLEDHIKDDFDEKSAFEIEAESLPAIAQPKQARGRLDLDEDFVDEPLTSPRLEALDEQDSEMPENQTLLDDPSVDVSSPIELTSRINDMKLSNDNGADDQPHDEHSESDKLVDEITSHLPSQISTSDAPPLPHRDRHLDPGADEPASPRGLSPHPDDKPPPLFAKRSEEAPLENDPSLEPVGPEGIGNSQETIDTTQGEGPDSDQSVLAGASDQSFVPHIENDVDGRPIVGDYLKMMFVEHKVVPTILVRLESLPDYIR